VTGKKVTPFLLARIKQLTSGRSLATNIALVKNNARVGAELARALLEHPVA
jgi:pseudouridine-5'-phosphate glycosidase